MSGESIKVCCRFRKERGDDESEFEEWEFDEETAEIKLRDKKWTYDYILNHLTEQDEMYEKVGKQTITDFMNGFNGTIFAYGQSGSGKTFSMLGPEDVTEALSKDFSSVPESVTQLYGITPRAVIQMFEMINNFVSEGSQCTMICSYIEIYNETIKCLLSKKENLKIREQPGMGMNVADKEVRVCKTPEEIFEVVAIASRNRAVTGTNQNARSSRSHTILLMEFEYHGVDGAKRGSRLNLVDLAGCERISKTGVEGAALKEAQKINQSLTTLGMCIMALTTPGSKHIPFRNSKLTLILKESLGGNSKTTLLCTASRRKVHAEESAQTLYFASRAKSIKNSCKSNVQLSAKELQYLADHMKKEILLLRGQLKKGGLSYNLINDPKLLAVISNNDFNAQDGEESAEIVESVDLNKNISGENPRNKRVSLLNLTEKDIILKYCELHAKYDNLLENAGSTIYKLNNTNTQQKGFDASEINSIREETDEKLKEIVESKNAEINALIEKIDLVKKENEKKEDEFNTKCQGLLKEKLTAEEELQSSQKEYDTLQDMFNMTQNEISFFQEKIEKKSKKSKGLKEELKTLSSEILTKTEAYESISGKLAELESQNSDNKKKVEELSHNNELLVLEVDSLKNIVKQKEEDEAFREHKLRNLQEEVTRQNEALGLSEKKSNEVSNKLSELEMKYNNDIESLSNKESFNQTQIESLKKENENLHRIMQEKISDQELIVEKEKILNESKLALEKRIEDLNSENQKVKAEMMEAVTKVNNEKSEMSAQIENVNRELKGRVSELDQIKFEYDRLKKFEEERLRNEVNKNEQLQSRIESFEKKIQELENVNMSFVEMEKKFILDRHAFEKDLKEKHSQIDEIKFTAEKYSGMNEKFEKENKDLKEILSETKSKLNAEMETDKKSLINEQTLLKHDIEVKAKKIADGEKKLAELKSEIKVLQDFNQKLQKRVNEVEIETARVKRVSTILQKGTQVIKEKAPLNKNIFGVLLKKTNNNILQKAIEENTRIQKNAEEIFKDKIVEFRALRENIITFSPKTVSSRSDISDIPDLDFQDEESFMKTQELLVEKEKKHQEIKLKKDLEVGNKGMSI